MTLTDNTNECHPLFIGLTVITKILFTEDKITVLLST